MGKAYFRGVLLIWNRGSNDDNLRLLLCDSHIQNILLTLHNLAL